MHFIFHPPSVYLHPTHDQRRNLPPHAVRTRRWLSVDGYPPDAAALERVMGVVRGDAVACELAGGRRVARTDRWLRIVEP